jgi:hypothetical protein
LVLNQPCGLLWLLPRAFAEVFVLVSLAWRSFSPGR